MLLPCLLDAHCWWTHSSLWSVHVRTVSWLWPWAGTHGLTSFWGILGRWPVLLQVSISRTSLNIFAYLCAVLPPLHIGGSYTYLAIDCHEKGDCCKFIYSQAIELAVPLSLYTHSPWMYSSACAHIRKHVGTSAHTVCTSFNLHFNFTTLIFFVTPASDFNGLLSSLLIDSWIPFMANE